MEYAIPWSLLHAASGAPPRCSFQPYDFNNACHGKTPKRSIEGLQICTQAKELKPRLIEGKDFVAIEQGWNYTLAAPGKHTGSEWKQTLVFPAGKRNPGVVWTATARPCRRGNMSGGSSPMKA